MKKLVNVLSRDAIIRFMLVSHTKTISSAIKRDKPVEKAAKTIQNE